MPLIDPVAIPEVADLGRVHFIAIGGAGMSGVALGFLARGVEVSGSDQADSEALRRLEEAGAMVWVGHAASHLGDAATVVVSSAVRQDNPELVEARRRGLTVLHRSTALAALMEHKLVIAVAGTHGKTTTSAMCVMACQKAGDDPSYVIGGTLLSSGLGSHMADGRVFVVEADESDGSFRQYPTTIAVITGVEADHLDNWGSPQRYEAGFVQFASGASVDTVVVNGDDPGASRVGVAAQAAGKRVASYGRSPDGDLVIEKLREGPTAFGADLRLRGLDAASSSERLVRLDLAVPGLHNLVNASAGAFPSSPKILA